MFIGEMPTQRKGETRDDFQARIRAGYAANREQRLREQREWRENNPQKVKEQKRRYAERHSDTLRVANKRRYERRYYGNHEGSKAHNRAYYAENRDIITVRQKAYRRNNPERVKSWRKNHYQHNRGSWLLYGIRKKCKQSGLECDLTAEWIQERINFGVCEMSGLPFDMETKRGANSPSVDRVIAGGPYTQANCRVILWSLNRALSNYGDDYMLRVFGAVLERCR